MDDPELLTSQEVALMTRAPVSTIRYWRYVGKGPHSFRIGKRVLYRRIDVEQWLTTQDSGNTPLPAA